MLIVPISFLAGRTIEGRVVDDQGKPLNHVLVKAGGKIDFTDDKGQFRLESTVAPDSVYFHKMGFSDKKISLKNSKSEIRLEKKSIKIPGYSVTEKREDFHTIPSFEKTMIKVSDITYEVDDISDLMKNYSSIKIGGNTLAGEDKVISLNGNKAKHTLIMFDGIVLNSLGEEFNLSAIPLEVVEKIEIVETGSSALGGSGAIGGIINILSKKTLGFSSESTDISRCSIDYSKVFGSFNTLKDNLNFSFLTNDTKAWFNLTKLTAENNFNYIYPYSNEKEMRKRENNEKKVFSLNGSLNKTYKNHNFKYQLFYQNKLKELPGPLNQLSQFDKSYIDGQRWDNYFNYAVSFSELQLNAKMFYSYDKSKYNNLNSAGIYKFLTKTYSHKKGINSGFSYRQDKLETNFKLIFRQEDFKYDYFNQDKIWVKEKSIEKNKMDNYASELHLSLEQDLFPFLMNENISFRYDYPVRYDEIEFDPFLSYMTEIEVGYENYWDYSLGCSFSNAFSLPSFYDLYWRGSSQVIGNPDLKAEKSFSWKIFAEIGARRDLLNFTYSKNDIKDLIYWHRSVLGWKPDNISAAFLENWKINLEINRVKNLRILFSWMRTFSEDRSKKDNGENYPYYGKELTYTPSSNTKIVLNYEISDLSFSYSYNRIGKQYPTRDHLWGVLDAYEINDISFSYKRNINNAASIISLKLNNILDKQYQEYLNSPQPGFNWTIKLNIKFNLT